MAPRRLAPSLQSLPPILHMTCQNPMPCCSKGARGLSVQLRVIGIFTDSSISPSLLSRQRPSRYTIRAGRNLPDKEFRYLRTVIVTAAVYWGFSSTLRSSEENLTHPLNLPAPGRCQSIYVVLTTLHRPVFLVNSRSGRFTATSSCSSREGICRWRHPFFRSYGVILPSSLTRVRSSTLGFSPRLPASVYGTVTSDIHIEVFLGSMIRATLCA